jgi:hypothetical protein
MTVPSTAPGFCGHGKRVASSELIDAVVATLVVSSFSLSLAVTITLLSSRISMAMLG